MSSTVITVEADARIAELTRRLAEAEDTLAAIRAGEVDAVVVEGPRGQQVYGLESPDQPFRVFVERMQEGAVSLASDGTVLYCNAFFAGLVGGRLEQVFGQPFQRFVAPGARAAFEALLDGGLRAAVRGASSLLSRGGAVPVHLSLSPLSATAPPSCCVVVTDLTEQERAKRLDAARQTAEAASVAKDQFLAVVSHELRTPLNAMLGWAQILSNDAGLSADARRGVEIIERNARAQAQLINDLLDISRITAGKMRLELRPVDLAEVTEAAFATVEPVAAAKGVRLRREIDARAGQVMGDPDRLQQVVWNLLSNAVKYTPAGGRAWVALRRAGNEARVEVGDEGQGIAPEFLPRLFGLFQQADTSTTRRAGGLGLGLAIVKQLTEMHGGHVTAHSAGVGRGSTFTVTLPLTAPVERRASAPAAGGRAGCLEGAHVLLVEDQADGRELARLMLARAGARVRVADSAERALEMLAVSLPDILVSDIAMPGMDGYDLMRAIRARGLRACDLPAVALTAFARGEDRRSALLAGFQTHVAKPIDGEELCAVVASLLGRTG